MTMTVGTKILAAAAMALMLSQAACGGRKPLPKSDYDEAFVDNMIRCLHQGDAQTRFGAVHALGRLDISVARKAIPVLRCMLYDECHLVRKEAARALKKLDPFDGELALAAAKSGNLP